MGSHQQSNGQRFCSLNIFFISDSLFVIFSVYRNIYSYKDQRGWKPQTCLTPSFALRTLTFLSHLGCHFC